MAALELHGLAKRFGETLAVDNVELAVEQGEVLALLGPSGCGKTTLLRLIAGLESPSAGRILFDGIDLAEVPAHTRGFGLVFQDYCLFPHLDVSGNVGYGPRMARWPRARRRERVAEMLRLVGLEGFEHRSVLSLSGGEQQRVALARGLALRPRLLMLDEPLGALDATLRAGLLSEVPRILALAGATSLYVTHEQDEALAVASRVAVMRHGRIVQVGAPRELIGRPADSFVAGFLELGALVPVRGWRDGRLVTGLGAFRLQGLSGHPPPATAAPPAFLLVRPRAVMRAGIKRPVVRARLTAMQPSASGTRVRLALLGDSGESWELWCAWPQNLEASGAGAPSVGATISVGLDPEELLVVPGAPHEAPESSRPRARPPERRRASVRLS